MPLTSSFQSPDDCPRREGAARDSGTAKNLRQKMVIINIISMSHDSPLCVRVCNFYKSSPTRVGDVFESQSVARERTHGNSPYKQSTHKKVAPEPEW